MWIVLVVVVVAVLLALALAGPWGGGPVVRRTVVIRRRADRPADPPSDLGAAPAGRIVRQRVVRQWTDGDAPR